jgi:small subunit ribosomal protein S1
MNDDPSPADSNLNPVTPPAPAPLESPAAPPGPDSGDRGARFRIGSQRPNSPRVKSRSPIAPGGGRELAPATTAKPNRRAPLSDEMEAELQAAMGGSAMDALVGPTDDKPAVELPTETRRIARIIAVHKDDVFVDLGVRHQGVMQARTFAEPPEPGQEVEVFVQRFDADEGLYLVAAVGAAQAVADWSEVREGMVLEAKVTGANKGGLVVSCNNLEGFIPAGQVALYRVEDLSTLVGEKWPCVVTQADPERRRLVLSRKALLEREREASRTTLLAELAEGQVRDGVVRSIQDFGAFIDLGSGVDGLLHVTQMSWQRVRHPSDMLTIGQPVRVTIRRIDPETRKISLGLRDLQADPWKSAATQYAIGSTVRGTCTKTAEFGAFLELEPGLEGLVHVSELSHQKVWRVTDVVEEGKEYEAKILAVDLEKRRLSLSIKQLVPKNKPVKAAEETDDSAADAADPAPAPKPSGPLKGGLGRSTGGSFGLKW